MSIDGCNLSLTELDELTSDANTSQSEKRIILGDTTMVNKIKQVLRSKMATIQAQTQFTTND